MTSESNMREKRLNQISNGADWYCHVRMRTAPDVDGQYHPKGKNDLVLRWSKTVVSGCTSAANPFSSEQVWLIYVNIWLVVNPPLWKIWKSVGMIIPNIWHGKMIFMFQTTNQLLYVTLQKTNIAIENGPFVFVLPIKDGDFPWLC